jgi:hypothetical protein
MLLNGRKNSKFTFPVNLKPRNRSDTKNEEQCKKCTRAPAQIHSFEELSGRNEHLSFRNSTVFRKKNVGVELSLVCRYAVTHISSYEYDHQKAVTGTNASDDNALSTFANSFPLWTAILQFSV